MKSVFIVYDPRTILDRGLKRYYGLPVYAGKDLRVVAGYPDTHVVLEVWNDAAGTITETTVAGMKAAA